MSTPVTTPAPTPIAAPTPALTPKWKHALDSLLDAIISNPRTSLAGAAAILIAFYPEDTAKITGIVTGVGLLLTKDGNKGSTVPPPEADRAIAKVEAMPPVTTPGADMSTPTPMSTPDTNTTNLIIP